ncbi:MULTISPECIES: GDSL-type esterase/lipase family protein [unclassified Phycicoccus]|uniref:GDSL-type esterase/lipase family protein n=1 Tax=unclassified Phycicoccus TaxID=2637926 RepID=UPI000702FC6A|nr:MULTISPECIES: GDSL-type esterase/lipase family protein [unclassified Phycicoccus]KRF25651.1 G-D-S-L family lipolytic protein [Phycicoccus sp. Soil803]KRF27735.1 G-D-S-L family lipolytic protein [Phycicoccus sp. Soil802]
MSEPTFTPSAEFQVAADGPRDVGIVFVGASLVAGVGDPKGQGWVSRVVGRTHHSDLELTAYNLGVRGDTTADVLARWKAECAPRWRGRAEKRLVISVGGNDAATGVTLARHRLNLANILDDAASAGIGTFVVSPPPGDDEELNAKLDVLVEAQADVCSRRGVPFVDCFRPLLGHEQWQSDLAASRVQHHPGQAGYGLIAWLVLHNGWYDWLQISPS